MPVKPFSKAVIAAARRSMERTGELVKQGVAVIHSYEYRTQYLYTELERIKPEMIAEATRDARRAAEQFAQDSGSRVGAIRKAQQDLIVGRISGPQADRTSVFRGMSGSPVYIDGKLVGAISYAFPFSKEPICGITPIEQIVGIFEQQPVTPVLCKEP